MSGQRQASPETSVGFGPLDAPRIQQVAPNVYAYLQPDGGWFVNNGGFLLTADSVIVVDSAATEARTARMRAMLGALTDKPVSTLINTHWHTDHTNGNYQFRGATIVAHERTRLMMLLHAPTTPDPDGPFPDVDWGALEPAPPFLTYDRGVTMWADTIRCDVRWVGLRRTQRTTLLSGSPSTRFCSPATSRSTGRTPSVGRVSLRVLVGLA